MKPRAQLCSTFQSILSIGSLLLSGCAADLSYTPANTTVTSNGNGTVIGNQNQTAATLIGGRVNFKSSDFYTLFNPQPVTQCAGDAHTYYDPFTLNALGTPAVLDTNVLDSSTTIRPSFIKNISVDITDSNVFIPTNKSFSCSYGQSSIVPSPSNCATFDNVADTFVSIATTAANQLLVGGAPTQNPYSLPSGNQIVRASALLGSYSVILPPAALNLGKVVFIEKTDASTNAVTVKTTGIDTVGDFVTAAAAITTQYGALAYTATSRAGLTPPYYWAPKAITESNLTVTTIILAATGDQQLSVDATIADVTLTLPAASAFTGHFLAIRKTDSSINKVILALAGSTIVDQYGSSFAAYTLTSKEPEIVLLPVTSDGGATYYWTTQNPEHISATTPYSIVAGNQFILVDATNSDLILTLPTALANAGKTLVIQRLDSSSHTVTLQSITPETLVDLVSTSTTLTIANPAITLVSSVTALNSTIYYWDASTAIPYRASTGYNTGYYTTLNPSCVQQGPIVSTDPLVNSTLVGGAYFDIDRSQLGPNENLLLNLTFFPMDSSNQRLNLSKYSLQEAPIIKVHLVKVGLSGDNIRSVTQPRILTFGSTTQYPQAAEDIAVIGAPTGQIQQQQIFLPIAIDPGIDRIHVQRYTGNIILIDATLFRMGYR